MSSVDSGIVRKRKRNNLFSNDLRLLMYAYGDSPNPSAESVAIVEDILTDYIIDMCHEAARMARTTNRNKVKVDDFKFALRKDYKKLGRVEELQRLSKEIHEARKTFDDSEGKSLSKAFVDKEKSKG
ncbi:transcription initiation factor IID, 18kD subunit-domain-containing protein [Dipodascopsis tothii]|uniref:transcription initiation factor IID, 18kD subunit-domain-containing protein n=1 Tax=Dipodascopsis tothii TaxID=44089 RepID=UPI0034CD16FB